MFVGNGLLMELYNVTNLGNPVEKIRSYACEAELVQCMRELFQQVREEVHALR